MCFGPRFTFVKDVPTGLFLLNSDCRWLGIVTLVNIFGARTELPGVSSEGAAHISGVIGLPIGAAPDMLKEGQVVEVTVLHTETTHNNNYFSLTEPSKDPTLKTALLEFQKEWLTENVIGLAYALRENGYRDRAIVTILADALEEAGCENESLLDYCRNLEAAKEWHGWWVAESILRHPDFLEQSQAFFPYGTP